MLKSLVDNFFLPRWARKGAFVVGDPCMVRKGCVRAPQGLELEEEKYPLPTPYFQKKIKNKRGEG